MGSYCMLLIYCIEKYLPSFFLLLKECGFLKEGLEFELRTALVTSSHSITQWQ